MKVLVNRTSRVIHAVSNLGAWHDLPDFLEVVEVPGDADQNPADGTFNYPWPNGGPTRCLLDADGVTIKANPAWVPPPDPSAFLATLKTQFGGVVNLNALATKYPMVFQALRDGAYADVKALVDDALAKGAISQAVHDQVILLGQQAHLW